MALIRYFSLPLLLCLACAGQSASADLAGKPDLIRRIEREIRSHYQVASDARMVVSAPAPSTEFPDYDAVLVTIENKDKGQVLPFLVSKDGSSLVKLTKLDIRRDPYEEIMSKIDLSGRPTRGAKSSKVVVVSYDDLQCPFCTRLHQTLFPEILKEYEDRVTFVYEDFPLVSLHPWAMHAAVDANCLASQNGDAYWDFVDYVHTNQKEVNDEKEPAARVEQLDKLALLQGQKHTLDSVKLQSCIKAQDESSVRTSLEKGKALGVDATPVVFVNGERVYAGALTADVLRSVLDRALKDAGIPHPQGSVAANSAGK